MPNDERIRIHVYGKINQNEPEDKFEDLRKVFHRIMQIVLQSSDNVAQMFAEAVVLKI